MRRRGSGGKQGKAMKMWGTPLLGPRALFSVSEFSFNFTGHLFGSFSLSARAMSQIMRRAVLFGAAALVSLALVALLDKESLDTCGREAPVRTAESRARNQLHIWTFMVGGQAAEKRSPGSPFFLLSHLSPRVTPQDLLGRLSSRSLGWRGILSVLVVAFGHFKPCALVGMRSAELRDNNPI